MNETTYTQAPADIEALMDQAVDTLEPVIVHRHDGRDVAIIAAAELRGLLETLHLFRSPKNAERLLRALREAEGGIGTPQTVEQFEGGARTRRRKA